jgi:hypothetical protein
MKLTVLIAVLMLALSTTGCSSVRAGTDDELPDAKADNRKAEMVCEYHKVTGSRIPQKVCVRKREADGRSTEDQADMNRTLRQGSGGGGGAR